MRFSPSARAWLACGISACGFVLSGIAERLHRELSSNASYTSFCNINSSVNCDVVLTSPWASFWGISVSLLGLVFYGALVVLSALVARTEHAARRRALANAFLLGTTGGLAFSVYMAVVALWFLHTVCLVCSGLYVVAVLNFLTAGWLRRGLIPSYQRGLAQSRGLDRGMLAAAVALLGVLALALGWEISRGRNPTGSLQSDPRFSHWFTSQPLVSVPLDGRNQRGRPDAPVVIVEFSDFECAHCKNFHRVVDEVWRREPRRLRVLFRHFPLNSECNPAVASPFHSMACRAAVAAECAGQQGKFWEYHDLLFAHQRQLHGDLFSRLARDLGLDVPRFESCLEDPAVRQRVQDDSRLGAELGVNSTPTLFINGRLVRGALNAGDLQRAIALAEAHGATSR